MSSAIIASGLGGQSFRTIMRRSLVKAKPNVIGVAVAYVSVGGFEYLNNLANEIQVDDCRLVADTRDAVTHPNALRAAMNDGWDVKIVDHLPGTFHPKLYIGGESFDPENGISNGSVVIAGSGNLSLGALFRNAECSYIRFGDNIGASAGLAWKECWDIGADLTDDRLKAYEKYFAARNRSRPPADLVALGVAEEPIPATGGKPVQGVSPPKEGPSLPNSAATVAWAGLQSFTGEYDLQVEFPRDAGAVLSRMLQTVANGNTATLRCEDGISRDFLFRFYENNGMWRLNVPNDSPNADWARQNRDGIALVEVGGDGQPVKFRIIKPSTDLTDVVDRSVGLGTWGKTPTRLYGWY
ncbi:MAG: phospholipase D family protein [Bradyrhizobium sp.]